jgi:nitrogen regulatory protein PII
MKEDAMIRSIVLPVILAGLIAVPTNALGGEDADVHPMYQAFDVDFPGGTLARLLVAIEGKLGSKPNVIASEEALGIVLPAFSLRQVTTGDLLQALEKLGIIEDMMLNISSTGKIITVQAKAYRKTRTATKPSTRIYDLRDVLGAYKIADIVTAVETAWEMRIEKATAKMKFHEETKILIAVGDENELGVIEYVLQELRRGLKLDGKAAVAQKAAKQLALAMAQKDQYLAEKELTVRYLNDAKVSQSRYEKQIQSYERQVSDLRARLRELTAEMNALRQKLEEMEAERGEKKRR